MPKTQVTTSIETPQPGILSKSGLDVTLENINAHLESIDKKLDDAPSRDEVEAIKKGMEDRESRMRDLETNCVSKEEFERWAETTVSKESFETVRRVVYGFVGVILLGVAGAIVALVIK